MLHPQPLIQAVLKGILGATNAPLSRVAHWVGATEQALSLMIQGGIDKQSIEIRRRIIRLHECVVEIKRYTTKATPEVIWLVIEKGHVNATKDAVGSGPLLMRYIQAQPLDHVYIPKIRAAVDDFFRQQNEEKRR